MKPRRLSYEYNLDGSLKTLHYPSGAAVTYTPDSAGRILSAVDSGNNISYATGATYGPDGALTGFVSGYSSSFAGITNAFAYNKRLQPLTMSATAPSQTVYSIGYDFHYGAGNNGNVFGIYNYKDADRNQTFTYDALNRLTSAQNAGTSCAAATVNGKTQYWGNNYGYDAWGNMLQKSITKCGAENLSVTADAHNWIHASGAPDYQYDAAGNMTYDATASLSYTFDQENRLTGANGYTYTYDGDGNRVRKSNGNTAGDGTLYWDMTPGVVAETDLAGTSKSEYVFFDGERVARRDGVNGAGGVFYYFSDHLKTASVITDSAGVIKAESDYYPWGGELQFVNNDNNDYKFTGKKRDIETGLDYFGARYYSNGLGRWVSADWSASPVTIPYAELGDPQTLNLYGYVRGLPTVKVDLDGHTFWDKFKNLFTDANCFCEGQEAEQAKTATRARVEAMRHPTPEQNAAQKEQVLAFTVTIAAYNAADAALEPPSGQTDELGPVMAYEVGTFEELSERAVVGDGLVADHIPSNASNIARVEETLGRPLTDAEKTAVRNQGTAVAVPDSLHKSASPTYGGRNTPAQIKADAANPQAAVRRDTQAMVKAASPANQAKAQAAAAKISSGAGGDW